VAKDDQKQKLRIIQENIETKLKCANDRRQEQGEKLKGKLIEHVSSFGMVAFVYIVMYVLAFLSALAPLSYFDACRPAKGQVVA
jgi:hypothetical protein